MDKANGTSLATLKTCIQFLNAMAGLTWVVAATCRDCGTGYPASPRQRVLGFRPVTIAAEDG